MITNRLFKSKFSQARASGNREKEVPDTENVNLADVSVSQRQPYNSMTADMMTASIVSQDLMETSTMKREDERMEHQMLDGNDKTKLGLALENILAGDPGRATRLESIEQEVNNGSSPSHNDAIRIDMAEDNHASKRNSTFVTDSVKSK